MPSFRYVAVGPDGNKRTGEIIATTLDVARAELDARKLEITSLKAPRGKTKTMKPEAVGNVSRQLAAFLRAGIPIISALEGIAEETTDAATREAVVEMSAQLRVGDSFAEAVASQAHHFPPYFPAIIASAELSGNLDDMLERLAEYIDRDQQTRRKVKGALTYPT
ncbi:MAG TPA: type II secretion system F family protein, partial [Acidimicrobiales bacterium]|nr:type II secretion system F family protein [Acidimicrobiales bacterium]